MSDATTTTTKKFSLPAKHSKFIQYGYFLINHLASNDTSIDTQKLLQTIHTFDEPIAQHAFVESFFSQSEGIAATIKNTIKTNRAALKQQTKASNAKPRSKAKASKQKPAVQDDLVAELVALAKSTDITHTTDNEFIQHETPQTTEPTELKPTKEPQTTEPTELKHTKEPKTAKAKEPKTAKAKEPKTTKAKEPKTTKAKEPKTTKAKANAKQNVNVDTTSHDANITNSIEEHSQPAATDDIELAVSIFKFNDKNYLIDDLNNVYDFHTHDTIGVFDKNKNVILPI